MSTGHQPDADGSGYTNAEFVEQAHEDIRADERARQEELTDAERKKQRVLDSIREKTVTVYVDGDHRAKFTRIMGEEEQWFREIYRKEQSGELTKAEDEEAERRMIEILADHAVADWIDREFVDDLPAGVKLELFQDIVEGGEDADEAGNSRGRTSASRST